KTRTKNAQFQERAEKIRSDSTRAFDRKTEMSCNCVCFSTSRTGGQFCTTRTAAQSRTIGELTRRAGRSRVQVEGREPHCGKSECGPVLPEQEFPIRAWMHSPHRNCSLLHWHTRRGK